MFYIFRQINFNFYYRRVHITKATLLELGDKFEVEDGKGSERDDILAKLNLETFLIIPPKQQVRKIDIVWAYLLILHSTAAMNYQKCQKNAKAKE